jgi:hypothetical protein
MRDKPLMTYLIVNICVDLGKSAVINRQSVLRPNAMIILALHWPCEGSGCAKNGIGPSTLTIKEIISDEIRSY